MTRIIVLAALAFAAGSPALAQGRPYRSGSYPPGTIVQVQPNTTGNSPSLVIARGSTGADTVFTNSAAGGNAGQPERAIPQGSAGGGNSGSSR
jgi:hypothetical protein